MRVPMYVKKNAVRNTNQGATLKRTRVSALARRSGSGQLQRTRSAPTAAAERATHAHNLESRAKGEGFELTGMRARKPATKETSRDSPVAVIPQAVTPRTPPTGRSGTRRARGYGGRGAPAEWHAR